MDTATLTVNAPLTAQITSFSPTMGTIVYGGQTALTWAVQDATGGIEIFAGPAMTSLTTSMDMTGSFTVTATATTDYTLVARNANGDAMASTRVTVSMDAPQISTFEGQPNPSPLRSQATLTWVTVGAERVQVYRVSPNPIELLDTTAMVATGSLSVTVTSTATSFRLVASNPFGGNESTVTIVGLAPPSIDTFDVAPFTFVSSSTVVQITRLRLGAIGATKPPPQVRIGPPERGARLPR